MNVSIWFYWKLSLREKVGIALFVGLTEINAAKRLVGDDKTSREMIIVAF